MRNLQLFVGYALGIAAFVVFILTVIETFVFWLTWLDVGGALFSIFLLPIAVLAKPLVNALLAANAGPLLGYLQIGILILLIWLGGIAFDAAESRRYRRFKRKVRRV